MDVAEDELLHAAAGMQTNGISSEKPEEEPDTAPAYLKGDLREDVEVRDKPICFWFNTAHKLSGTFDH